MSTWGAAQEKLHPRAPEGTHQGGEWIAKLSSRIGSKLWGHYKPGRDLSDWATEERVRLHAGSSVHWMQRRHGSWLTSEAGREQGWRRPIRTATEDELDAAVQAGGREVWRGVRAGKKKQGFHIDNTNMSAHEVMDLYRQGEFEWGNGLFGGGIYTSPRPLTPMGFAKIGVESPYGGEPIPAGLTSPPEVVDRLVRQGRQEDKLARMVIMPGAKTIEHDSPEFKELLTKWHQEHSPVSAIAPWEGKWDEGAVMAALGYDVIYIDSSKNPEDGGVGDDQYIILNPSVLLMSEAPHGN